MNFNSVVFLFCFMPLALGLYYLVPGRVKNAVLLVESLLFFCWGGITWLPLAVGMVAINYAAGLLLASLPAGGKRKIVLIAAIVLTAAALVYCKYTNFLLDTLNVIASTGFAKLSFLDVLPLGISYYTFKLISYTADVYTGKVKAERSPVVFAVYVLMYPQLIVGPIVKYRDMADVLHQTQGRCTLQKAQDGAEMFVFGLAKKVILADSIAALWQDIIGTGGIGLANASLPLAWLGIIAYSLQLYFDFAGYSEMSNGLSLMMGLNARRTLTCRTFQAVLPNSGGGGTSAFRLVPGLHYIPLGGNRCSAGRQMLNMLAVWALTGIWHGANWNFICWGLYYSYCLSSKRTFDEVPEKRQGLAAHLHIVPGGTGLGAVHLQRPRCTAGAAAQPVVHPAGRRFGAVFPAQLCGAAGCVLRLLHPTAGAVLAVVQRQSPATGSALRRLLCSVHGVCGSSNGFHRTVCKLLRGGMALWKNMFTADPTVICRQLP